MELMLLDKKKMPEFISELISCAEVLAPVQKKEGVVFAPVASCDDICLEAANTKKSVKELFFPQREQLFSYRADEIREPSLPNAQRVVLGVRPCDARSLAILDNVFSSGDCPDPYYMSKRQNTVVVALGCTAPESTCFCTSIDGDPCGAQGADVLMVDTGEAYVLEPATDRGEAFLAGRKALAKADGASVAEQKKRMAAARAALAPQVQPAEVKKKLDVNFEAPIWARLHEKCLGCGICTFLCPTCHCFDMLDEAAGTAGERIRIWDSCMFPLFTLHASGANPRPGGKERVRQRIMHKFKYFVDNFGMAACTGCGRCIKSCPVNLDIRQALNQIQNDT